MAVEWRSETGKPVGIEVSTGNVLTIDETKLLKYKPYKVHKAVKTLEMLTNAGYRRIALITPEGYKAFISDLIGCLADLQQDFKFVYTRAMIEIGETQVYLFKPTDHTRLRGPNFDAAIICDNVDEEFIMMLGFCLRLGDNPIKVLL